MAQSIEDNPKANASTAKTIKYASSAHSSSVRAVPLESNGLNFNFCKNPQCANFGVPIESQVKRGARTNNRYSLVGFAKDFPGVRCNQCGEHYPLKSNAGVFEEQWRIEGETFVAHACPDFACSNHRTPIQTRKAYQSFGVTQTGSKRYRCQICKKTFSVKNEKSSPVARHVYPEKNALILKLLVNKMPLRRICSVAEIAPRVLYERINFFYDQALALLSAYESNLDSMPIRRLYIGVDKQDYAINWSDRTDKKNTIITAIASADNLTGYVFGMHPNFDPNVDKSWVEDQVVLTGDDAKPAPFRTFARLWLTSDFCKAIATSEKITKKGKANIQTKIANAYTRSEARLDVESPELMLPEESLPQKGALIHCEYTLYGHFLRLRRLLNKTEKIRFFLDQDSGLRAACLGVFADRIIDRTVDAFYVRITKDQTVDTKRRLVAEAQQRFVEVSDNHPELDRDGVRLWMLKEEIRAAKEIGQWKDRWVMHPLPTISESEKASCFLTDRNDYDEDHQAWLHNKASLHAVDSWFNRIRRRSSILERPIGSAANRGRVWNGYSTYRPEQVAKLLTIMRACHNYIWLPDDLPKKTKKETPAMRLGLTDRPLSYEDLILFTTIV